MLLKLVTGKGDKNLNHPFEWTHNIVVDVLLMFVCMHIVVLMTVMAVLSDGLNLNFNRNTLVQILPFQFVLNVCLLQWYDYCTPHNNSVANK
jgi:hypothetical protein